MRVFDAIFIIQEEKNCPLYKKGDCFRLSEKTFSCPENKEVCLILVRDMTELLFKFVQEQPVDFEKYQATLFNCSGCRGLIKFSLKDPYGQQSPLRSRARIGVEGEKLCGLVESPFLQTLRPGEAETILSHFREIEIEKGDILIRKGEINLNLYLVCSGELFQEEGGQRLVIRAGEICGEMSYLGADMAVATVRAGSAARLLAIAGDEFGRLFGNNPKVQSFMARLLAARLRKTAEARARDLDSCMVGKIEEMMPAELFQIFHMQQKTGVLTLELSCGIGKVSFREGCLINACYGEWRNEEAVFKIIAEKTGRYRFTSGLLPQEMRAAEIGDFMSLLMEGVKRVDEENERLGSP